jgi:hypothetical protein
MIVVFRRMKFSPRRRLYSVTTGSEGVEGVEGPKSANPYTVKLAMPALSSTRAITGGSDGFLSATPAGT